MAKGKTAKKKALSPKKETRLRVIAQLKENFPGLQDAVGTKEFNSRIKKAAKILTAGIKIKTVRAKKVKAEEVKATV